MRITTQNSIVNCINGLVRNSNVEGTCVDRMDLGSYLCSRYMQWLSLRGTSRMASFDGSSRFARFAGLSLGQPAQVSAKRHQKQAHVIGRLAWFAWQALELGGLTPAPVVATTRTTERGTYRLPTTRTA